VLYDASVCPPSRSENVTLAKEVFEQVKVLPEPLARKVLDFATSLRSSDERSEFSDLMLAQERSLAVIWDNAEDDVWNDL
jgi:hypothetical protein